VVDQKRRKWISLFFLKDDRLKGLNYSNGLHFKSFYESNIAAFAGFSIVACQESPEDG
jgi:hypothetical protein